MKRTLTAALVLIALAACNKTETVDLPQGMPIAFDDVFVDNATKATDLTGDNITDFAVYGFVEANGTKGQIFNNEEVTGQKGAFTYSPVQYWIAGAKYNFTAIAPYQKAGQNTSTWGYSTTDAQNGTIVFHNSIADASQDLLVATHGRTTDASITSAPAAVAFTFQHVLSRVMFTFKNQFPAGSNITIKVTDVTITNSYPAGSLTITDGTPAERWDVTSDSNYGFDINFGGAGTDDTETTDVDESILGIGSEASTEHFYLIPAKAAYNVTFQVTVYQAGVQVGEYDREATLDVDMGIGKSYDITASLTPENATVNPLQPIVFDIHSVEEWETATQEVTVTK